MSTNWPGYPFVYRILHPEDVITCKKEEGIRCRKLRNFKNVNEDYEVDGDDVIKHVKQRDHREFYEESPFISAFANRERAFKTAKESTLQGSRENRIYIAEINAELLGGQEVINLNNNCVLEKFDPKKEISGLVKWGTEVLILWRVPMKAIRQLFILSKNGSEIEVVNPFYDTSERQTPTFLGE